MTSHRIGVNLRVSGNCDQGARKYMEDNHVIKFLKKDTDDYEFAYFGVFDGHGGPEASVFCRDNLLNEITKYDGFWSNDDEQVLSAIKKGFLDTHNAMWSVIDTWPKTLTGLPSTSGTTCTIAIVKQGKLYTGHVGDSGLVLGENDDYAGDNKFPVQAICVTKDHKPDDPDERMRIQDAGGEVISKSGVPRVVWSRPKTNHKGPVRRSTQIDQIPFLAVARSLGDLWSYDYYTETYVVSPEPDVSVLPLDPSKHRCLILASDGLWNMLTPEESVNMVMDLESQFEQRIINDPNVAVTFWSNPAERLVARALNKWRSKALKADNTSCVVVLIDPLGPSKLTLLKRKRQELLSAGEIVTPSQIHKMPPPPTEIDHHRCKSSSTTNYNANCSISDSHIRVNDESILFPSRDGSSVRSGYEDDTGDENPGLDKGVPTLRLPEDYNDSINDSLQFSAINTTTMKDAAEDNNRGDDDCDNRCSRQMSGHCSARPHTKGSERPPHCNFNVSSNTKSHTDFTKLNSTGTKLGSTTPLTRSTLSSVIKPRSSLRGGRFGREEFEEEEEVDVEAPGDGLSDISEEAGIPQPPPSTPCTGTECDNESDGENSLQSSAEATDLAFSLASDESLESPQSSFEKIRPVTPLSAPAKLNTNRSRKHGNSKGKSLFSKANARAALLSSKPPTGLNTSQTEPHSDDIKSMLPPQSRASAKCVSKSVSISVGTSMANEDSSKVHNKQNGKKEVTQTTSPPRKRVLNTSLSMNDVITPKNRADSASRSISCTGLTPTMNLLMSHTDGKALTTTADINSHLYSSFMAADKAKFKAAQTLRSNEETSMVVDDSDFQLSQTISHGDPLKQLNKTGPIRKMGSKRFGNFLRTSKINLDQVFHIGSHRKSKKSSHSTGRLELEKKQQASSSVKNTSMSTSKLTDITQSRLPDITLSHYADYTLDASSLTAGDLTNLSALSADDSMLSASILDDKIHHSMLDPAAVSKAGKNKKGFLQKTRFTLRRARKAAKKAFFPENHRLFQHKTGGTKRKSDEFLPTPELKRRKQLMTEKC